MRKNLQERITDAVTFMKNLDFAAQPLGKYEVDADFYYVLQAYDSKSEETARYEAHRKYVDVQFIVEGCERIDIAPLNGLAVETDYAEEKDVMFLQAPAQAAQAVLTAGGYVVLYPEDAHRPGVAVDKPAAVKKIVGKVRV